MSYSSKSIKGGSTTSSSSSTTTSSTTFTTLTGTSLTATGAISAGSVSSTGAVSAGTALIGASASFPSGSFDFDANVNISPTTNGGIITYWADKSSGATATIYNNALTINSGTAYNTVNLLSSGSGIRFSSGNNYTWTGCVIAVSFTLTSTAGGLLYYGSHGCIVVEATTMHLRFNFDLNGWGNPTQTGVYLNTNTPYILTISYNNNKTVIVRINGIQIYTATNYWAGTWTVGTSVNDVGYITGVSSSYIAAKLSHFILIKDEQTASAVQMLENYLSYSTQIAIQSGIYSSNPYLPLTGVLNVNGAVSSNGDMSAASLTAAGAVSASSANISGTVSTTNLLCTGTFTPITLAPAYFYPLMVQEFPNVATYTSSNVYTLENAVNNLFYLPTDNLPTANFSVFLNNIPAAKTDSTYYTTTITLMYYQSTNKYYCNAVRVRDTASVYVLGTSSTYATPLFNGGTPTISNSPCFIIQQFNIVPVATSTATSYTRYVTSSVNVCY